MKVNFFKKLTMLMAVILIVCLLPMQAFAEEYYLKLSTSLVSGTILDGQWYTLTVSSNVNWTVTCTEPWMHVSKTSGIGNDSFTLTLDPYSGSLRSGLVIVEGEYELACGNDIEQCAHPNMKRKEIEGRLGYTIYESYHTVQKAYEIVCEDCGRKKGTEISEPVKEKHTYVNGKCVCSKEETECKHENCIDTYDDQSGRPVKFSNITATHHDYQNPYICTCNDCGRVEEIYADPITVEHTYTDGVCVCGASEPECEHKDYTDNDYYGGKYQTEFSNITETTHDVKIPYRRTCDDCGEVLKEGHYPAQTQKHTFKNGVCACGYEEEPECEHEDYTDDDYYDGKYQTEFSNITETTHDVKIPYRRTCNDCGEVLKEGHYPAQTQKHTFKNGMCACGYEEETDECTTHSFSGSKCKKCGFIAYIYCKDTAKVGDTITLGTNLPKGDYTFSVGKNLSLSGNKATAVAAGKGNVWLYYKGSGNTVASCVVEIECKEHTAKTERTEVEYHNDGNTHTVITTTYGVCACGYEVVIDTKADIAGHVDNNDDGTCDLCDGKYNADVIVDEHVTISSDPEERERQFYTLLNQIEEDEKLDNRIYQIIQMNLQDEELPTEYIDSILNTLKTANSPYRELYLYSMYEYNTIYYKDNIAKSGYFSAKNNSLEMGAGDIINDFLGGDFALMYFHEVGHAIDVNADWASVSQELAEALWNDATNVINNRITQVISKDSSLTMNRENMERIVEAILGSNTTVITSGPFYWNTVPDNLSRTEAQVYAQVVAQLNKEIADAEGNNASMVVDILNALSNHTLHDWVIAGHDMDYWYNEDGNFKATVTAEAWAEFFAAKMTGFTEQDILNREYFPDACKFMEHLTKDMLEHYKEQAKQH